MPEAKFHEYWRGTGCMGELEPKYASEILGIPITHLLVSLRIG
jgi:hypothetical protein